MVFRMGVVRYYFGDPGVDCIVLVSRSALNLVITGRRDSNLTCPSTNKLVPVRSVTFHTNVCALQQDLQMLYATALTSFSTEVNLPFHAE